MAGAFDVSMVEEFEYDFLRTQDEILRCGVETLPWLVRLVTSDEPPPVDVELLKSIHRRWFETTFPEDAGQLRQVMVLSRKGTAAPVPHVLPGVHAACENWRWRREQFMPGDELEQIAFLVSEANALAVTIYDVHPFIDGNTRATWHLRNYVLMLDGLRPLIDLLDYETYEAAWWAASPQDHAELDHLTLQELEAQDR